MSQPISELHPRALVDVAALYKAVNSASRASINHLGIVFGNTIKTSGFSDPEKDAFTMTTLLLANNQINEACNKFYGTVELANSVKERTWGGSAGVSSTQFSGEFTLGALIPVLYYSQVAALLSLFSSYGLIFVRDPRSKQIRRQDAELTRLGWQDEHEFLIVRSYSDWLVKSRSRVAQGSRNRFHQQLISIGQRFFMTCSDATGFDFDLVRELKTQRESVDYNLLGATSMLRAVGFQRYLQFIPRAYKNIKFCIQTISKIDRITNNCDLRMQWLEGSALALLFTHPYTIRLNLLQQMPSTFVVNTS
ncbi:MAG: hypothetical protein ACLPY5_04015 [Candidatus Bathyarchaeia archaeon]